MVHKGTAGSRLKHLGKRSAADGPDLFAGDNFSNAGEEPNADRIARFGSALPGLSAPRSEHG